MNAVNAITTANATTAITVYKDMKIVIPREVTESLRLKPGQMLAVLEYGGQIRLVRVPDLAEARGMLGPTDVPFEREPDREF